MLLHMMLEGFSQPSLPIDEPSNFPQVNKTIQVEDDDYVNKTKAEQTTDKFYQNIEKHSELIGL